MSLLLWAPIYFFMNTHLSKYKRRKFSFSYETFRILAWKNESADTLWKDSALTYGNDDKNLLAAMCKYEMKFNLLPQKQASQTTPIKKKKLTNDISHHHQTMLTMETDSLS